jgi:3-isopropylmalate dehydrogenase
MIGDNVFEIAVLPGDGIGVEVMEATIEVVDILLRRVGGFQCEWKQYKGGAQAYLETGVALSDKTMKALEQADSILFGAMGLPHVRYADGTEIRPQLDIRLNLDLYAGVRPIRAIKGLPSPLSHPRAAEIDFVLIREQTEGLYWSYDRGEVVGDEEARDTMLISRKGSERIFDFALRLAEERKLQGHAGKVTCVDKSNVLTSMAFMRRIFTERAAGFPEIMPEYSYIDAMALNLVRQPWSYDVIVTENMFGDILSDLGAGLIGGMGMAPSGDIGDRHGLFQPAHGSAPDIAGTGRANPTAMLLSAAMMLEWLGHHHNFQRCLDAAEILRHSVDRAFEEKGIVPFECGGGSGTREIQRAVAQTIKDA